MRVMLEGVNHGREETLIPDGADISLLKYNCETATSPSYKVMKSVTT